MYIIKDKKRYDFVVAYSDENNYYSIKAICDKQSSGEQNIKHIKSDEILYEKLLDGKVYEMGFLNFTFISDMCFSSAWIYKLKVDKKFAHQGIGSALISLLEYMSYKRGTDFIEGRYFPDNEYAKPFYEKNGYTISLDGGFDDSVYKHLSKKDFQAIEPNIYDYNVVYMNDERDK